MLEKTWWNNGIPKCWRNHVGEMELNTILERPFRENHFGETMINKWYSNHVGETILDKWYSIHIGNNIWYPSHFLG
jgi:hypothetical protein